MQQDEVTWGLLNGTFCSFKINLPTHEKLCRNSFNVTGMCNRKSCPLSNSKYATVREKNGILYLYMKTVERIAFPNKLWERVKLSSNFETAVKQLNENLLYWPQFLRIKCKLRFKRLTQVLIRSRRLKLKRQKLLVPIKKKIERREKKREEKALIAAKIENETEKTLMNRLKERLIQEEPNVSVEAFEQVSEDEYEMETEEEIPETVRAKIKEKNQIEYIEHDSDSETEREFISDFEMSETSDIEDYQETLPQTKRLKQLN